MSHRARPPREPMGASGWIRGACFAAALVSVSCAERQAPNAHRPKSYPAAAAPSLVPTAASAPVVVAPEGAAGRVDLERLRSDVTRLAIPREPGSAGWRSVQQLTRNELERAGFRVTEQNYGSGTNIVARSLGPIREQVVVSAHYDHIAGCAGADDNASGVAAALEVARVLGPGPFARTVAIALWDEEERGLLGSRAFAEQSRKAGDTIVVAISLDAIGAASSQAESQRLPVGFEQRFPAIARQLAERERRADFIAAVSSTSARDAAEQIERGARHVGLPLVRLDLHPAEALLLPDTLRSDHASFWLQGIPALLLTDTGDFRNPRYHCGSGPDTPESLDYEFLRRVTGAVVYGVAALLQ